jgi:glycerophosphoryl diester phosphodiesterase
MAGPALVAHRGFALRYPENTVPAFEAALANGADGVEFDVRAAATGDPVVCHDATVDRTTDGSGAVDAFSPAELAALSVAGSDAGVPTLDAVLDALPPETTVYAELKESRVAPAAVERLAAAPQNVLVSSFDSAALSTPRDRGLPTALLAAGDGATVDRAADLGCTAVHLHVAACTEGVVDRAHDRGLDVAAWTLAPPEESGEAAEAANGWAATDPAVVDRLRAVGVDALIADAPV